MRALLVLVAACGSSRGAGDDAVAIDAAGDAAPDASADVALWHDRADQALDAMLLHYWNPSYFDGAAYWTLAQAYDAVLDGIERTGRYTGWAETRSTSPREHELRQPRLDGARAVARIAMIASARRACRRSRQATRCPSA